jgi:hypothetical protein
LWEPTTGKEIRTLATGLSPAGPLAFSPDDRTLLAGTTTGGSGGLGVFDVTTGTALRQWLTPEHSVGQACFSPDGRTVAASVVKMRSRPEVTGIALFELATGKERRRLGGVSGLVNEIVFSPDGRTLAASAEDPGLYLWDTVDCRGPHKVEGHVGYQHALAFAPDGRVLAAGGTDTSILLWNVEHLRHGMSLPAEKATVFEPDALWADLASDDASAAYRSILVLAAHPREAVSLLKERVQPRADERRLAGLIADLDADEPAVREKATQQIVELGDVAEPALRRALAGKPSLEVRRRLEQVLGRLDGPDFSPARLRSLRAVEALEKIGTAEARAVLRSVAEGEKESRLTRETRATLGRLAHADRY